MTDTEKTRIEEMRKEGLGYGRIAKVLGLSDNTVKSYCRRNNLKRAAAPQEKIVEEGVCRCCGKPVMQIAGRKEKKFCSDVCRMRWWNEHKDLVNRKALYEFTCAGCGKKFSAYGNAARKYCSHECYIEDRFGGDCYD